MSDRPLAAYNNSELAAMAVSEFDPLTVAALLEITELRNELSALGARFDDLERRYESRQKMATRSPRGKRPVPEGQVDR